MRQEEVRNLRILYNEHCLGSYRFSARPAKISLSNMRGLCRNISLQDVSSSVMHSVGKNVRLGFSVKCYGKTWTNVLANPILLSIKPSQTQWHKATSPPFDCAQRVCGSWVWTGKKGVIYLCSMYLGASARKKKLNGQEWCLQLRAGLGSSGGAFSEYRAPRLEGLLVRLHCDYWPQHKGLAFPRCLSCLLYLCGPCFSRAHKTQMYRTRNW